MQLYIDVSGGDYEETAHVTENPEYAAEDMSTEAGTAVVFEETTEHSEETDPHTVSGGDSPLETQSPPSPSNDLSGDLPSDYALPVQESEPCFEYTVSSGSAQPEVPADSSALLTELTGVNERLTLLISLLVFAGLWCIGKAVYRFFGWFF